jgi:hypothetical protein
MIDPSAQFRFLIDMFIFSGLCIYIFVKRHEVNKEITLKNAIYMLSLGVILLLIAMTSFSVDQGTLHFAYSKDCILYQNNGETFSRYCRSFGYVFTFLGIYALFVTFVKRTRSKNSIKNA